MTPITRLVLYNFIFLILIMAQANQQDALAAEIKRMDNWVTITSGMMENDKDIPDWRSEASKTEYERTRVLYNTASGVIFTSFKDWITVDSNTKKVVIDHDALADIRRKFKNDKRVNRTRDKRILLLFNPKGNDPNKEGKERWIDLFWENYKYNINEIYKAITKKQEDGVRITGIIWDFEHAKTLEEGKIMREIWRYAFQKFARHKNRKKRRWSTVYVDSIYNFGISGNPWNNNTGSELHWDNMAQYQFLSRSVNQHDLEYATNPKSLMYHRIFVGTYNLPYLSKLKAENGHHTSSASTRVLLKHYKKLGLDFKRSYLWTANYGTCSSIKNNTYGTTVYDICRQSDDWSIQVARFSDLAKEYARQNNLEDGERLGRNPHADVMFLNMDKRVDGTTYNIRYSIPNTNDLYTKIYMVMGRELHSHGIPPMKGMSLWHASYDVDNSHTKNIHYLLNKYGHF